MVEIEIHGVQQNIGNYNYINCSLSHEEYSELCYNSFFERYMLANLPCIIKNVSAAWECTKNWIRDGTINYEYLSNQYGDLEAPVADCDKTVFNSHTKIKMKVSDYMQYLQSGDRERILYLKDWHLKRERPSENFYEVPFMFASDWLNEYAVDHQEDDFMFVYIGPKDSWTPLHADVYNSYSWSVNVVGKKKWIMFPPGEEEKLKDCLGNLPIVFDCDKLKNVQYYEIEQEQGDAIFVPSGWYHQVVNLCNTISINHNWINSCNVNFVWKALQNSLASVEHEIEEFKNTPEFSSQCQLILKSLFGMDCTIFITFLSYIGKKRLNQLYSENCQGCNQYNFGKNHIKFDLCVISNLMDFICKHPIMMNSCLSVTVKEDFISIKTQISNSINMSL